MTELAQLPAWRLAERLRAGEISSVELLEHFSARFDKHNPDINAIVWTDFKGARARAAAADKALAQGEVWGPLHGLPMTVKESFDVVGAPSSWGMPSLKANVAQKNAVVVERLLAAGAIIFGKSNVPVALSDAHAANSVYGRTANPWSHELSPGGSSGGAAAAIAAGLTALEYGSDLGGSIRNPAHACGVVGHKPSDGIVPTRGHSPIQAVSERDLGVVGPIARSARDLMLALDATSGPDTLDAPGWRLSLPVPSHTSLSDYRVAFLIEDPACPIEAEYAHAIKAFGRAVADAGAHVSFLARPHLDFQRAFELYVSLLRALVQGEGYAERFLPKRDEGPSKALAGPQVTHAEWLAWDEERARARWRWHEFFREWDVLITPIDAGPAIAIDPSVGVMERVRLVNGAERPASDVFFWAALTTPTKLPATAIPIGLTHNGLPLGVQVVGDYLADRTTIHFAQLAEELIGTVGPPSGY